MYYRLAELEILQPALKECKDDILPLAEFFRKEHSGRIRIKNEGFTEEAKACMLGYDWPGNVRELNAKIKRAVIVADNALLDVCDLGLENVDCNDNPIFVSFRKRKGYEICLIKIMVMSARQQRNSVAVVQPYTRK